MQNMKRLVIWLCAMVWTMGLTAAVAGTNTTVVCDSYQQWHQYNKGNDWLTQLRGQGWYVYFNVKDATVLEEHHEYSGAEMLLGEDYTYAKFPMQNLSYTATEATYTQWHDEYGLLHIVGTMVAEEEHDHSIINLIVTYDETGCVVTGETKTLVFDETDLADDTRVTGMFQFIGKSATEQIFILFKAAKGENGSLAGEYDWSDVVPNYTGMNIYEDRVLMGQVNFCDLTATITDNAQGGYDCTFNAIGKDGNGYMGTIATSPIVIPATDTVIITADNLEFAYNAATTGEMQIKFSASDDTYSMGLWLYTDTIEGDWSFANGDFDRDFSRIRYQKNGAELAPRVIAGEVSCHAATDGSYLLSGWVNGEDAVHYKLQITKPAPKEYEQTREETIVVTNADVQDLFSQGAFYVKGYTADKSRFVEFLIGSDQFEGEYTDMDMSDEYTFVAYEFDETTGNCSEYFELISATATVTVTNGVLTITAQMLAHGVLNDEDVPMFTITMTGDVPGLIESIACDAYVSNYSGGEWMFSLTSTNGKWNVVYYVQVAKDGLENGTTYMADKLQTSYARYLENPQNPSAQPVDHPFEDCTFTLLADDETKMGTIDGTFVSKTDGKAYHIHYAGAIHENPVPPTPPTPDPVETTMEDDEAEQDFVAVLPAALATPYTQPMLGEIEIRCYDANTTKEVSIVFMVDLEDFDQVTYVPAGEYEISSSRVSGTVYAGQGVTLDGSTCIGSYAATMQGEHVSARWYIREGKVTVANYNDELYLHLVGKNSKSQTVDITIGKDPAEGLDDPLSTPYRPLIIRKCWNGTQLVIIRDSVQYTILGTKL